MRIEDFQPDCPGRLEPTAFAERFTTASGWDIREVAGVGFVPDPLPPEVELGVLIPELITAILAAERELSLLEGTARRLPNPHLLIDVFAQREAILSSAIENTFASAEDLALLDVAPQALDDRDTAQEVRNYVLALTHGFRSDLPICLRLIREMHRKLIENIDRSGVNPGEFRQTQNAIGATRSFADAKFVPPPPRFLDELLRDFESFIHVEHPMLPRLLRFAMLHYQFETIHPFLDGNGRVGRLLITLMLCEQGQLTKPLVYVSGYFERNRDEYYRRLYRVSTRGEWQAWFEFFLDAVVTQARDAVGRADRLLDLQSDMHRAVREKRASALLPGLIDSLFARPYVTANSVQKITGCSPATAGKLIQKLVDKKILRVASARKKDRLYEASRIVDLIMN